MTLGRVHNQIGKPSALPGDSRSSTVLGILVRLRLEFASFPLTPTLSPRRGRALASRWKIRRLLFQSPLFCARRCTATKLGRISKAWANVSPSPGGEGGGEGEEDTRRFGRILYGLGPRRAPEGPHGFEAFIISSLRLCRRSLTGIPRGNGPAKRRSNL